MRNILEIWAAVLLLVITLGLVFWTLLQMPSGKQVWSRGHSPTRPFPSPVDPVAKPAGSLMPVYPPFSNISPWGSSNFYLSSHYRSALSRMPDNCLAGENAVRPERIFDDPFEAFRCLGLFENDPMLKGRLLEAMKPDPYWASVYYLHYAHKSWAGEVFLKSIELDNWGGGHEVIMGTAGWFKGHSMQWWEEEVPGVTDTLRRNILAAASKPEDWPEAVRFLEFRHDFPDREALLSDLVQNVARESSRP